MEAECECTFQDLLSKNFFENDLFGNNVLLKESLEETLTKALAKLAVIDSRRWISFLLDILPRLNDVAFDLIKSKITLLLQQAKEQN